jgi:hypothetical protein
MTSRLPFLWEPLLKKDYLVSFTKWLAGFSAASWVAGILGRLDESRTLEQSVNSRKRAP